MKRKTKRFLITTETHEILRVTRNQPVVSWIPQWRNDLIEEIFEASNNETHPISWELQPIEEYRDE